MNSNNNNNSSGSSDGDIGCHFLPTSSHFLDFPPSSFHLDSPFSFPHLLSSPPPTTTTQPIINPTTSPVGPTRPSKKRSRASRRAPTTVLTTDTSNFRAMVQEFTGIPAPPFSTSAASTSLHFPRSCFHLNPFPLNFQSTTSGRNPNSNFRSLLNLPQPPAPVMGSNSGGLDLPGIIGPGGETRKLNFSATGPIPSTEKGEGLMESWICSSD